MKKKENILKELKEISPTLTEMPLSADLFKVPDGYFEGLAGEIILKIRSEEEPRSLLLEKINKTIPYHLPLGYFDGFAAEVIARIKSEKSALEVSEELQSLSPLLSAIEKKPAYTIPEGYFKELPIQASESIRASESVDEEMENLPSWLRDLKTKETYTVPQGYFDGFAESVLSGTRKVRPKARVVSFSAGRPWMKYAVAAAFTGVLLTIGFFTFNKTKNNLPLDPIASLSKVSNQEMINYLESQDLPVDETVVNSGSVGQDLNDNDIIDLFDEIPDADLLQYANNGSGLKDL
jgi:hypothetical protein